MSVTAAIEALRRDAELWDRVARVTGQAGQEAAALTLDNTQLSWASVPTGLMRTYAEIQGKVAGLLGEATTVYADLGVALDTVAAAYEASDEKAARQFEGVWDVRE
ncbi:hypothetical protein Ade02nite_72440 [Paractinoplanes deccanensis]|uniref:Excreted virulence factor EspC (Type VII ESX diderm) n=1 Tax=Paractinoplanes deccanensis TaxID=113561 RepID=A0ABQ3YF20_9ACTN|nr:hypothetical protein [Actinoplanes deccanensis]GID78603.1 hypothetical protein Ade02nite_72440 [Actinoplanes deccanensis]